MSSSASAGDLDVTWLRPCCTPIGCLLGGQVNLTEPEELEKIICSNEACTTGPYMHKECFERWEDGLLTYLRSHGRARSWSEKQRRQNLWTKRGYDLAFRACNCICNRGHLRKDLNWNPQDVVLPFTDVNSKKIGIEEGAKKKNRKKHKDLPALGNKYTFGGSRSKSKAIPNNKDNRVRTNSTSSVLSIDQGYSSSSPSNSEIHGTGFAFFSPPQNSGRSFMPPNLRNYAGYRNGSSYGLNNSFPSHSTLQEIPDNDVLDFYGKMSYDSSQSPMFPPNNLDFGGVFNAEMVSPRCVEKAEARDTVREGINEKTQFDLLGQIQPLLDHRFEEISKMMHSMGISKPSLNPQQAVWNESHQQLPMDQHTHPQLSHTQFDPSTMPSINLAENNHTEIRPGTSLIGNLLQMQENIAPFIGHWNPDQCLSSEHTDNTKNDGCHCSNKTNPTDLPGQNTSLPFQGLYETATTMLCSDIDLKKPKVLIIPEKLNAAGRGTTCTEISITPMCSTTFNKRYDFKNFQGALRQQHVNPYHIKMEGEGYGSDDFRNSVLSKLSQAKCSWMNCILCARYLPIYDHYPLLDGTMFLSPLRNEDRAQNEIKIEVENKCEYLHAVCIWCLEGINNIVCKMCETKWNGTFHQLGSLYMYDIFAAAPCCESRLLCKRCGVSIVDRRAGLKYYSEYSRKATCPSCGSIDYHFVHPASTYKIHAPDEFPYC
ncbi:headcase protein homolog isoform X2 [Styela clava]